MGGSTKEGNITKEAEFNILVDPEAADICFKSGVKLRMLGFNVTRQILVTPEIISKAEKINTKNADLFVSIHLNSSEKSNINGIETHWYKDNSKELAQLVQAELMKNIKN